MNFFKSFFNQTPQQQTRNMVEKYLSSVNVYQKSIALPLPYEYLLQNAFDRSPNGYLFFGTLIQKLNTAKSVSSSVKLFTIIHHTIYYRSYKKQEIQPIQEICSPKLQNQQQAKWFDQFSQAYCTYLKKLINVSEIFAKAKHHLKQKTQRSQYLEEVFRIINHLRLLFPSICTFTNVIGRYYLKDYPQFPQFYRILNKELTEVYAYFKEIIEDILIDYQKFPEQMLRLFMQTIPEIQLICDKLEDILLNKYFKGKSIKGKIYIKQEKAQQIKYYLEYEIKKKLQEETELREDKSWN